MQKWVQSNLNKEKITMLFEERRDILQKAVIENLLDRNQCLIRLKEISNEIAFLYATGKEVDPESPIEQLLYSEMCDQYEIFKQFADDGTLQIIPQFDVGSYRVDFAIIFKSNGKEIKLAIECDGFEFHDSSIEQATYDKQRERRLVIAGFTVLRFSGHEINDNVKMCVADIFRCIRTMTMEDSA